MHLIVLVPDVVDTTVPLAPAPSVPKFGCETPHSTHSTFLWAIIHYRPVYFLRANTLAKQASPRRAHLPPAECI